MIFNYPYLWQDTGHIFNNKVANTISVEQVHRWLITPPPPTDVVLNDQLKCLHFCCLLLIVLKLCTYTDALLSQRASAQEKTVKWPLKQGKKKKYIYILKTEFLLLGHADIFFVIFFFTKTIFCYNKSICGFIRFRQSMWSKFCKKFMYCYHAVKERWAKWLFSVQCGCLENISRKQHSEPILKVKMSCAAREFSRIFVPHHINEDKMNLY